VCRRCRELKREDEGLLSREECWAEAEGLVEY
jgi:hypothetical protein